jgi:hypothetical protein
MADYVTCNHCNEDIELNERDDEYGYQAWNTVYEIECPHCEKKVFFEVTSAILCYDTVDVEEE